MNTPHDGIPIIGQQQRVFIADHRVIAPNSVEVVANGLSMGTSIAHLRIMAPLKAECIMVPLVRDQARQVLMDLARVLGVEDIHISQEG